MDLSLDSLHFLIFLLPGFVLVWTYRHHKKISNKSDVEYLMLSAVWGILFFFFIAIIGKYYSPINKIFSDNYAAAVILIILAFPTAWIVSEISETYKDPAVKTFFKKLRK